jgi:hypothetical protein
MSHQPNAGRNGLRAVAGLDFGLRVRVEPGTSRQQSIFAGAEDLSVHELTSELAEQVSKLRVFNYTLRGQLEEVTYALQTNVSWGSWRYARRAALDLAGLLASGQKRRLIPGELAIRAANAAERIADLCTREVR